MAKINKVWNVESIEYVIDSAKTFDSDFCAVASWLHKKGWAFKGAYGRMNKKHILKENAIFEYGKNRIVIFGVNGKYDSYLVLELDKLEPEED